MAQVEVNPSPLIIRDAYYGGAACRGQLYNAATFEGYVPTSLNFDTQSLNQIVGRDPLPGQVKTFSSLCYYPESTIKLFTVTEQTGRVTLTQTSTSNTQSLPTIKGGTDALDILAVVYGPQVITDQLIYDSIYARFSAGKTFVVSNDSMGGDPTPGVQKTAVLYMRSNGQIRSQSVIEGGTFNPLI